MNLYLKMFKQGSPHLRGTKLQPLLAYKIIRPWNNSPHDEHDQSSGPRPVNVSVLIKIYILYI